MTGPAHDAGAMAGWAQLLHDVVERRLHPSGETDLVAPSWDAGFDDALAVVLRRMVAARLAALSPEQFVAVYRSVHGDAALLGELERVVGLRAHAAAREAALLELASDARVAGRLRLDRLSVDETVDVGLFDPAHPELLGWRFRVNTEKRPLHRVFRVRLTAPATGEVTVVSDTWRGAVWAHRLRTPAVPPMTAARLGSSGPVGPVPELTLAAPVVLALATGTVVAPPQVVGYVRTLDGRLLLDAPP